MLNILSLKYCQNRQTYLNNTSTLPKNRIEIISPYPQYTQEQLNMRRKVEILKHTNSDSVLANSLTKKQKWSTLNRKITTRFGNLTSCPKRIQPTPTSSSDIPGPVVYLLEDDSIPLYNFATVQNYQLPMVPNSSNKPPQWLANAHFGSMNPYSDIVSPLDNSFFVMGNLTIVDPNMYTTIFQLQTPVSLQIAGKIISSPGKAIVSTIVIEIVSIEYETQFLGSPVILGGNIPQVNTLEMKKTIMSVDMSNSSIGDFTACQYINNLVVNNILLQTQPGDVYDLLLKFTLQYTLYNKIGGIITGTSNVDSTVQLSAVVNLTDTKDPYYKNAINCALLNPPNGSPFQPFTLGP
jgi:hypothetical protein